MSGKSTKLAEKHNPKISNSRDASVPTGIDAIVFVKFPMIDQLRWKPDMPKIK